MKGILVIFNFIKLSEIFFLEIGLVFSFVQFVRRFRAREGLLTTRCCVFVVLIIFFLTINNFIYFLFSGGR